MKPVEVAAKYDVSRSAVTQFIERHSPVITALQVEAERQVQDYAIASKVWRVKELDSLYNDVSQWIAEHGFTETSVRYDRDGNEVGRTERLRADALAQVRGLLDDAAKELGHRVTKGDTTNIAAVVNIIRGGTPLGMQPIDTAIEATYTVEQTGESLEATEQ